MGMSVADPSGLSFAAPAGVGQTNEFSPARLLVCLLAFGASLTVGSFAAKAQDAAPQDFQVKAAYLVNFPKYVVWPPTAFAGTNSPITVAIFGDDNVAAEFRRMIQGGRTVDGHPFVLKRVTKEAEIGDDCHILFIARSEHQQVPAILEKIKGSAILTVGEGDDFLELGGIVRLVHRDRKIRLHVNLSATGQSRLKISSRLLVVADAVQGKAK